MLASLTALGVLFAGLPAAAADPAPAATAAPAAPAGARPCAPADLTLREVSVTAEPAAAVYALKNHTAEPCRISGGVAVRLFDAKGDEVPLRFAPRTAMAMLLTLAPGDEASFTVAYEPPAPNSANPAAKCAPAARIQVSIPPQLAMVGARTSLPACAGTLVRVSNLRLGVAATPLDRSFDSFVS